MPIDVATARRHRVILVGAGHAHLHIASLAAEYQKRGVELLLIDPGCFWYSGMATGMLSGQYRPEEDQIDPQQLIETSGGRFVCGEVDKVDVDGRRVHIADGDWLDYDWLSLNLGSEVVNGLGDGSTAPRCWPVKPIPKLAELRATLTAAAAEDGQATGVCVIGGGPTGCELTANLLGLAERESLSLNITLVSGASRLLPDASAAASRKLLAGLRRRGARVLCGQRAVAVENGAVVTDKDSSVDCDHVLMAAGLRAKELTRELGVAAGPAGVKVNAQMQSVDEPTLFAAGDCADFQPRTLPKLGVFGVKAAEVIHQNLLASIDGKKLKPYQPQRVWLAVLNLGNGKGLAMWWRLWWFGGVSLWLKDRIDRKFMRRYRTGKRSGNAA